MILELPCEANSRHRGFHKTNLGLNSVTHTLLQLQQFRLSLYGFRYLLPWFAFKIQQF